jgi:hypothetical protein
MGAGFGLALLTAVGLPAVAHASPPPTTAPFTECPTAGVDSSCATLITVNSDGSTTVTNDPGETSFNGSGGDLVGIVNNSNARVSNIGLAGSEGNDILAFSGQGVCAVNPSPCFSSTEFGPTGYEGPGTSFSVTDSNDGTVSFAGGLSPGTDTYFSLESSPFSVPSVAFAPDIALTVNPITATAGVDTPVGIASFTDGGSTAPPTEFSASINWGDGSPPSTGVVSQGSSGTPYQVTADHDYAAPGTYGTTVTITDTSLPVNTVTGTGSADVTEVITASAVSPPIPSQTATVPFTDVPVATFVDSNSSATVEGDGLTASIDWGDGSPPSSGAISQPGGLGSTFDVSGGHTYGTSGTFTVTVTVSDSDGDMSTITESVTVADEVITCTGGGCGGTVSGSGETADTTTTSSTGVILVNINPNGGTFSCGDSDRHAPDIVTLSDSGIPPGTDIHTEVIVPVSELVGPASAPVEVCFQSTVPFQDLEGNEVTIGLLPACRMPSVPKRIVPCVDEMNHSSHRVHYVYEKLIIPSNDPKWS